MGSRTDAHRDVLVAYFQTLLRDASLERQRDAAELRFLTAAGKNARTAYLPVNLRDIPLKPEPPHEPADIPESALGTGSLIPTPNAKDRERMIKVREEEENRILKEAAEIQKKYGEIDVLAVKNSETPYEPSRPKTHWDYVLDEMAWLAKDFREERRWKIALARKVSKAVQRHFEALKEEDERASRARETALRRIASEQARQVRKFWDQIEKLAKHKLEQRVERERKQAKQKHLQFLIGETERYSHMLATELSADPGDITPGSQTARSSRGRRYPKRTGTGRAAGALHGRGEGAEGNNGGGLCAVDLQDEYAPDATEGISDDESTISKEEALDGDTKEEVEALQQEQDEGLDELLASLPPEYRADLFARIGGKSGKGNAESGSDDTSMSTSRHGRRKRRRGSVRARGDGDERKEGSGEEAARRTVEGASSEDEFMPDAPACDDESTIAAAEKAATSAATKEEIANLQRESEMPIEEVLEHKGVQFITQKFTQDVGARDAEEDSGDSESSQSSAGSTNDLVRQLATDGDDDGGWRYSTAALLGGEAEEADPGGGSVPGDDTAGGEQGERQHSRTAAVRQVRKTAAEARPADRVQTGDDANGMREPFLLRAQLRDYQKVGLRWLASLYEKRLNGILADEMGLGKTVQTIALLAWLAVERGIWGPHLVIVPTSVLINWEIEFKKFCPAFKILTYYGTQKERKQKRRGWTQPNAFSVCITSYNLAVMDQNVFRRKKWVYMILDEAQNIKNFQSQRWQVLLGFQAKRRLLLTGTPLQNSLMELWSLMHFLMPNVFESHSEFKDWFSNPITGMIEGESDVNEKVVKRLHGILRPFLLRRMKKEVELQLPDKTEHVVPCSLSKRQRQLYEEYMAASDTQDKLSSGSYMSIISVLMQLRKVCNHPDLFEPRPIVSALDFGALRVPMPVLALHALRDALASSEPDWRHLGLDLLRAEVDPALCAFRGGERALARPLHARDILAHAAQPGAHRGSSRVIVVDTSKHEGGLASFASALAEIRREERASVLAHVANLQRARTQVEPVYGADLRAVVSRATAPCAPSCLVQSAVERFWSMRDCIESFLCVFSPVRAGVPVLETRSPLRDGRQAAQPAWLAAQRAQAMLCAPADSVPLPERAGASIVSAAVYTQAQMRVCFARSQLYFPDKRLLEYDCGKLQKLVVLLRRLKSEGHRVLVFTQMTRMLDVLEEFLNFHGHTYLRLDGSTKVELRQKLMERFNTDPKVFAFILTTRAGGLGINLTGADTVIFFDSDWNPAMDAQAQDRCHRIGQTRDVHIYRLVTEHTIEENILLKATQKRFLDDLVVTAGGFTTDFFKQVDLRALIAGRDGSPGAAGEDKREDSGTAGGASDEPRAEAAPGARWTNAEVEAALATAEDESDIIALQRLQKEELSQWDEFDEDGAAAEKSRPTSSAAESSRSRSVAASDDANGDQDTNVHAKDVSNSGENPDSSAHAGEVAEGDSDSEVDFESELMPVQRLALRALEKSDWLQDEEDAARDALRFEERGWELEKMRRDEEKKAAITENDDVLFYDASSATAEKIYREQKALLEEQQALLEFQPPLVEPSQGKKRVRQAMDVQTLLKAGFDLAYVLDAAEGGALEARPVESADTIDMEEFRSAQVQKSASLRGGLGSASHHDLVRALPDDEVKPEGRGKKRRREDSGHSDVPAKRAATDLNAPDEFLVLPQHGVVPVQTVPTTEIALGEPWSPSEERALCAARNDFGNHWILISDVVSMHTHGGSRSASECEKRWIALQASRSKPGQSPPSAEQTSEKARRRLGYIVSLQHAGSEGSSAAVPAANANGGRAPGAGSGHMRAPADWSTPEELMSEELLPGAMVSAAGAARGRDHGHAGSSSAGASAHPGSGTPVQVRAPAAAFFADPRLPARDISSAIAEGHVKPLVVPVPPPNPARTGANLSASALARMRGIRTGGVPERGGGDDARGAGSGGAAAALPGSRGTRPVSAASVPSSPRTPRSPSPSQSAGNGSAAGSPRGGNKSRAMASPSRKNMSRFACGVAGCTQAFPDRWKLRRHERTFHGLPEEHLTPSPSPRAAPSPVKPKVEKGKAE